jgi:hypothetical protein
LEIGSVSVSDFQGIISKQFLIISGIHVANKMTMCYNVPNSSPETVEIELRQRCLSNERKNSSKSF